MINYIIKEKTPGKKSAVSAVITSVFSSKKPTKIKIALGVSIAPEDFGTQENNYNYDSQHLLTRRSYEANLLRSKIIQINEKFNLLINHFLLTNTKPTKEEFEDKFLGILIENNIIIKKNYSPSNIHYFDEHIFKLVELEQNKLVKKEKKSDSTFKTYSTLYRHVLNYNTYYSTRIIIEEIKVATILDVVELANKIRTGQIIIKDNALKSTNSIRNKEGYSTNSINILIANIKAVLRKIDTDVIQLNVNLNDFRLKKKKAQNSKKIYLNANMLDKIYNHTPKNKRTLRAKDYVILASSTGMRYQGVAELHKLKVKELTSRTGDKFFAVENRAAKTGTIILSPIFHGVKEIYDRGKKKFPKIMYSTRLSEALRELLIEVGISHEVPINEWVHDKGIISNMQPITEVISSHDCRKSFVTNLLQLGINSGVVRSMTHEMIEESSSSFNIYDNTSAVDRAITFYENTKHLNTSIYRYK